MKYNTGYRKLNTTLNLAPTEIDPSPSTVDGARSLVERYQALKLGGTEVGGGVVPGKGGLTSLATHPPTKPKRGFSATKKQKRCPCGILKPEHAADYHLTITEEFR